MRYYTSGLWGAYFGGAGPGGDISLYVGSWAVEDGLVVKELKHAHCHAANVGLQMLAYWIREVKAKAHEVAPARHDKISAAGGPPIKVRI